MLIIIAIKAIFFDWIIEWLFTKSYQYLVLINYDRSFKISRELLDAICAYPANAFKPRKYHFLTERYNDIYVPAKSISKVKFNSMISASLDFETSEDSLDWLHLLHIDNAGSEGHGYNEVDVLFENPDISNFILYLKDFFAADYGYVCKAKNCQSKCISNVVSNGDSWQAYHKKILQGCIRDIYPVNILNSAYVQDSLINKIKEDERMGNLDSSVDGYIIWNVEPSNIRYVRRVCKKMGLLISAMRVPTGFARKCLDEIVGKQE
jgi:hypothetical protein